MPVLHFVSFTRVFSDVFASDTKTNPIAVRVPVPVCVPVCVCVGVVVFYRTAAAAAATGLRLAACPSFVIFPDVSLTQKTLRNNKPNRQLQQLQQQRQQQTFGI